MAVVQAVSNSSFLSSYRKCVGAWIAVDHGRTLGKFSLADMRSRLFFFLL